MSAVVSAIEGAVDTVVEAVGDAVESVGDALKDVGKAIDDYVIQPIKEDPLTAIASVAAAAYLGPAAAAYFGTSAAVGTGLAVAGANTAAGLVQGESFDEAIKGGAMAGLTAGGMQAAFGTPGVETPPPADPLDQLLAENNNFANVDVNAPPATSPTPGGANVEVGGPIPTTNGPYTETTLDAAGNPVSSTTTQPSPVQTATPAVSTTSTESPLSSLGQTTPTVEMPTYGVQDFTPDYSLGANIKPSEGFTFKPFTPEDSFNMYGEANYSITPEGLSGPGLQPSGAPNLARMGGGTGLTADVYGMPAYTENGVPTTWVGENGQVYGNATPDMTISSSGIRPTPDVIPYGTENMGTMSTWDKAMTGDLGGVAKDLGADAWAYAKEHPWYTAAGVIAADQMLNRPKPPEQPTPNKGGTRDANFNKSLDLYAYLRDKNNYKGDITRYGQKGQGGEQNFFTNVRFEPVPIQAKMGGLIQMKRFAQGGQMQGGMMPEQPMVPQNAPQGMPPQGGRPPMQGGRPPMQGGRPPMQGGLRQGMPPQGGRPPMQGQPQMQGQRPQPMNRNPKTSYYQYGNPPVQQKAMGGLSQVHSMKIGGGADGRSDDVNAVLSDGEYVFDAESVAMLGNGSSKAGAAKLDQMRSKIRQHKGKALASGKISPDAKSPLAYLKGA